MKAMGKTPQALLDKPNLPWYYEEFIRHYIVLSNGRSYHPKIDVKTGPMGSPLFSSYPSPNPIDISDILRYNKDIVKMDDPEEFISIVQTLDHLFLKNHDKKRSQ